ncbi:hypothetical protein JD974_12605 [Chromobacterium haemolyticum]|uniref:Uncharacterized protein n=1 Tax=Chromobacterium haemolyticum TaxID=394935 RepID=A0ABS3GNA4_9NEIS|nr:hypothetical protein [Chromobacterium haemolyticum]MBK0415247.1 hypothetical protein [Chromobacterium haemolyticum]MBO0416538.1 hypothetical protein [Chromobacterium haemolyticum]MBO0499886.1 hypothetical protein [Chromobacterium haemolyticum]
MQQNLIDAARAIGTKPVAGRYFLCLCGKCGWLGSSEECRLVEDPLFGDGEYFCAVCGASEPDEVDAAEAFNAILAATASRHPDDVAVDRFALAMKAKLAVARDKGRSGWDDPAQCSVEFLAQLFVGHIGKDNAGNFEDVANLAMMLHQRGADPSVLAEAAREKPAGEPVAWRHSLTHSLHDLEGEVELADGNEWAEPLYTAPPVPADAFVLLEIWQTWLGAGRESCSEHDKPLWDRIDAVLSSKEPKHD